MNLTRLLHYLEIIYRDRLPEGSKITFRPTGDVYDFMVTTPGMGGWAEWGMRQFPGCCGICISFHASVDEDYESQGYGTILNELRIDLARLWGYGLIMATDIVYKSKSHQMRIFTTNEWTQLVDFRNPRTYNTVGVFIKPLVIGGLKKIYGPEAQS